MELIKQLEENNIMTTPSIKEYPHYKGLPAPLRTALNMVRFDVFVGDDHGEVLVSNDWGHTTVQDLEFLNLDALVGWIKDELPEFDRDYLEAAARLHNEHYYQELFNLWAIDTTDLFDTLLYVKDEYELKLAGE